MEGTVSEEDGYTAESDAAILLDGLDIPEPLHHRKMGELQGDQKVRVLLAQALFGHPQALLLDEPTNYLDLESIHWLQNFLTHYEGVRVVIDCPSAIICEARFMITSENPLIAASVGSSPCCFKSAIAKKRSNSSSCRSRLIA